MVGAGFLVLGLRIQNWKPSGVSLCCPFGVGALGFSGLGFRGLGKVVRWISHPPVLESWSSSASTLNPTPYWCDIGLLSVRCATFTTLGPDSRLSSHLPASPPGDLELEMLGRDTFSHGPT